MIFHHVPHCFDFVVEDADLSLEHSDVAVLLRFGVDVVLHNLVIVLSEEAINVTHLEPEAPYVFFHVLDELVNVLELCTVSVDLLLESPE